MMGLEACITTPSYFDIGVETAPSPTSQLAPARKTLSVTCCLFSSSSGMDCLTSVLRITNVTDKDLSQKYDCLALNHRGVIRHTLQLREKQPSKACPSH